MNVDDTSFTMKYSSNPSLRKECSIIWNETWNSNALLQVFHFFFFKLLKKLKFVSEIENSQLKKRNLLVMHQ